MTEIVVGYHFHQRRDLAFADVANTDPAASYAVTLLDDDFESGILPGEDFVTEYQGFVVIDADTSAQYDFELSVDHIWNRGEADEFRITSRQEWTGRLHRSEDFTLPLAVFNARSQVALGTFTDGDGRTIEITEALLAAGLHLTTHLKITRPNGADFALDSMALSDRAVATYYQLQPELSDVDASRIAPQPTRATRGRYLRQAPDGESIIYDAEAPEQSGEVTLAFADTAVAWNGANPAPSIAPGKSDADTTYDQAATELFDWVKSEIESWAPTAPSAALNRACLQLLGYLVQRGGWAPTEPGRGVRGVQIGGIGSIAVLPGTSGTYMLYSGAAQVLSRWHVIGGLGPVE